MACQLFCLNHTTFESVQPVYLIPSLTCGGSYSNRYTVLVLSVWLPKVSLWLELSGNVCCAGGRYLDFLHDWLFFVLFLAFFCSSLLQLSFPSVSVFSGHFSYIIQKTKLFENEHHAVLPVARVSPSWHSPSASICRSWKPSGSPSSPVSSRMPSSPCSTGDSTF